MIFYTKTMITELKLNLACGNTRKEGFAGVDIEHTSCTDYIMDLTKYPWDIESDSVDEIFCSHYIEHIPHNIHNPNDSRDGFIQFMDEVYRVLKVGGRATLVAPYLTSVRAFQDPTHCRYICKETFYYFNKQWINTYNLQHYNIKSNFDINYSYYITNELTLKSEEIRNNAFNHDWNAIDDIIIELTKLN